MSDMARESGVDTKENLRTLKDFLLETANSGGFEIKIVQDERLRCTELEGFNDPDSDNSGCLWTSEICEDF